jgi:SAM-dependent methyltransferase
VTSDLAVAYSRSAAAWADGPGRVYDALAEALVARSPVALTGRRVADVGSGRGAASRALRQVGAEPIAVDVAEGMLAADGGGIAADALALPFRDRALGGIVGAFSYNHLVDPVRGLAEARRVVAPGGAVLVSAYAADDDHPAKAAVDGAAIAAGWAPPGWIERLRRDAAPHLATVDRAAGVARRAGLPDAEVAHVEVAFPEATVEDLLAWRLGMAPLVPFLARLDAAAHAALVDDARARLGEHPPPLVRRMVVVAAAVA